MESVTNTIGELRDAEVEIAGERILLMPERSLFWPARSTLFVADVHFGKAATFRAGGIFVPPGTTTSALARLSGALDRTGARRLVLLGDLLHAREGRSAETLRVVAEWRAARQALEVVLVRGNHDRRAGDPPEALGITCADPPVIDGAFAFAHHPNTVVGHYALAGHVHPAVRLRGSGRQSERLACFWLRPTYAVLPAFGDFTGVGDIDVGADDRVFVVAGDIVVETHG